MGSFEEEAGVTWSPEEFQKLFKTKETTSPRDALVNMVAKAMSTGSKTMHRGRSAKNEAFFAGRVSGYVNSAAILAELMYGCDYELTRKLLSAAVKKVRSSWSQDSLRDAATVGVMADGVVTEVLLAE